MTNFSIVALVLILTLTPKETLHMQPEGGNNFRSTFVSHDVT